MCGTPNNVFDIILLTIYPQVIFSVLRRRGQIPVHYTAPVKGLAFSLYSVKVHAM